AVELARRGFRPRVIDRNEGPTPLSKAVGISAHSLELLEPVGVTERLLVAGQRIPCGHIHFNGRPLGTIRFSALRHRFNFLLALPQSETEAILAEVLAGFGIGVERRTALVELAQGDGGVAVVLDGPAGSETARYDCVYGADGVHSKTREGAGIAFDGYSHRRDWSIADAELADWPHAPGAAHLFLRDDGDVGFIIPLGPPGDPGRFRAISNTPDALARIPGSYRVARLLRSDVFHIPVKQAPTYQQGRVFLGGDAAHVHSPVGGRGMNLGIEDACAFARRYAEGALDGYTAERHPAGARWIAASERTLAAVQATGRAAVIARNLAIRTVGSLPALQRRIVRRAAGL
ncbi:MAG: FAD-dependent oxidoreductase, partial [Bacteroidota bacterium]